MNRGYTCNVCGKEFTHAKTRNSHQELCGIRRLDQFGDDKARQEFTKLDKMSEALRINDYDRTEKRRSKQTKFSKRILDVSENHSLTEQQEVKQDGFER